MMAVAVVLAWVAALAELLVMAWRGVAREQFIFSGIHATWLVPLSYLAWFGVAGVVATVVTRWWPALGRVATGVLAFGALFSVAFLFHPALHLLASGALSAGAAFRLGPLLERASRTGGLRRGALAGAAVVALLAAGAHLREGWQERGALRLLGSAGPGRPNVLLLILDTVRASSLGLYGHHRATSPQLDSIARTGVAFERAISPAPWTLPSHASIFTGVAPHGLAADWDHPLERGVPTLAEAFATAGYRTAGFVGNLAYTSRETGLARGFSRYEDYVPRWGDLLTASATGRFVVLNPRLRQWIGWHDIVGRRTAAQLNAAATRWIAADSGRPFFAFINYYDAHEPYLPAAPFDTLFGRGEGREVGAIRQLNAHMAERAGKMEMSPEQARLEELAYDQSIAWLDHELGVLMGRLGALGIADRTIVAITADHGEQFGELGLYSHGNGLYLPALHVPLILAGPGVTAGARRPDVASTTSLGATLLDLAGVGRHGIPGRSLLTAPGDSIPVAVSSIRPARNQDPRYPSARDTMYSATTALRHLVTRAGAPREVFDVGRDPRGVTRAAAALDSSLGPAEQAITRARSDGGQPRPPRD